MWTRKLLKTNAKQALMGRYWGAFFVCLILSILGVASSSHAATAGKAAYSISASGGTYVYTLDLANPNAAIMLGFISVILIFILAAAFCWTLFLINPLTVGRCRYFLQNRAGTANSASVTSVFHTHYLNIVKVQFLTNLKIAVGYLLFVIPGIYWTYCYTLVPYLLAENPNLTTGRAMELSKQAMDGDKFNYFVLLLSFIGWDILAALAFGIGGFFLEPYKQATFAEFYQAMRAKAVANGLTTESELCGAAC